MKQRIGRKCKKGWAALLVLCMALAGVMPAAKAAEASGTASQQSQTKLQGSKQNVKKNGKGFAKKRSKMEGDAGTDGGSGMNGTSGTNGDSGTGGNSGTDGTSGSDGASGTGGDSDTDGTPGSNGPDGAPGTDGTETPGTAEGNSSFTVTTEGGTREYPLAANPLTWEGKRYKDGVTPQNMDGVWMAPVKHTLSAILGCDVVWNDAKDVLTIKSPSREYSIQLTLNSSQAQFGGEALSMPAPVLQGTLQPSGETEVFVPMEFVLGRLGFDVSVEDGEIYIYTDYIFYKPADTLEFDSSVYENALESVFVKEDGMKEYVQGITCQPVSKESVSIRANGKEYQVMVEFAKTKNTVGEIDKKFTGGIVTSLKVWETEEHATCIAITYNKKYIYSKKFLANGAQVTFSKGSFSLKAFLPDDIDYSEITTTDQYWKNKFLIIIPGNYVSFYKKYAPVKNTTAIKSVAVAKTAEGNTKLTVTTSGLKGYKLAEGDGFFTVAVGSPSSIYENIVMLDAGHGGKDNGARSNGLKEKALNLRILYTYAKSYFEDIDSPVKAYWTRHDDTFINLYDRPTYPEEYEADLFVSLHMNSASRRSANGTEVYYSKNNNGKAFSGLTSKIFASRMKDTLVDGLNNKDRGVKQAGFVVVKYNTVPSILIELGFITGNSDRKKLAKTTYQKKAARVLYEGITDVFEEFPTDR